MPEVAIGSVSDFFARPVVAGITLTAPLKAGDTIHIKGHTTDVTMTVSPCRSITSTCRKPKPAIPWESKCRTVPAAVMPYSK